MSACPDCPTCGRPWPEATALTADDRLQREVAKLRAECERRGLQVNWEGKISERSLNELQGQKVDAQRKRVTNRKNTIPFSRFGSHRLYSLSDIAKFHLEKAEKAENEEKSDSFF